MAKLSIDDVKHVAKLARLDLTPEEISKFQKQLAKVIDYFQKLNEADVSNVVATSQTTGLEDVFRIDKQKTDNCLSQEEALSGTDKTKNGYFVVDGLLPSKDE